MRGGFKQTPAASHLFALLSLEIAKMHTLGPHQSLLGSGLVALEQVPNQL